MNYGGTSFDGWPFPRERRIKVLTAIFDTPPGGGGTGLVRAFLDFVLTHCLTRKCQRQVPGSHRLPDKPDSTLLPSFLGGHGHYHPPDSEHPRFGPAGRDEQQWLAEPGVDLPSSAMVSPPACKRRVFAHADGAVFQPNHVETAVAAGSAVVMDVGCWHCALPNTSGRDRVYTICGYVRREGEGPRPTGELTAAHERLDQAGLLPTSRKRALGLGTSNAFRLRTHFCNNQPDPFFVSLVQRFAGAQG